MRATEIFTGLAGLSALVGSAGLATPAQQIRFNVDGQNIAIMYSQPQPDMVEFSANIPSGWAFSVAVDGNQDGRWGLGVGLQPASQRSEDRQFGQEPHGFFCSTGIITANAAHPELVDGLSACGELPSAGSATLGPIGLDDRGTVTLKVPVAELFGTRSTANIQICLWEPKRVSCQHSPQDPLILTRLAN